MNPFLRELLKKIERKSDYSDIQEGVIVEKTGRDKYKVRIKGNDVIVYDVASLNRNTSFVVGQKVLLANVYGKNTKWQILGDGKDKITDTILDGEVVEEDIAKEVLTPEEQGNIEEDTTGDIVTVGDMDFYFWAYILTEKMIGGAEYPTEAVTGYTYYGDPTYTSWDFGTYDFYMATKDTYDFRDYKKIHSYDFYNTYLSGNCYDVHMKIPFGEYYIVAIKDDELAYQKIEENNYDLYETYYSQDFQDFDGLFITLRKKISFMPETTLHLGECYPYNPSSSYLYNFKVNRTTIMYGETPYLYTLNIVFKDKENLSRNNMQYYNQENAYGIARFMEGPYKYLGAEKWAGVINHYEENSGYPFWDFYYPVKDELWYRINVYPGVDSPDTKNPIVNFSFEKRTIDGTLIKTKTHTLAIDSSADWNNDTWDTYDDFHLLDVIGFKDPSVTGTMDWNAVIIAYNKSYLSYNLILVRMYEEGGELKIEASQNDGYFDVMPRSGTFLPGYLVWTEDYFGKLLHLYPTTYLIGARSYRYYNKEYIVCLLYSPETHQVTKKEICIGEVESSYILEFYSGGDSSIFYIKYGDSYFDSNGNPVSESVVENAQNENIYAISRNMEYTADQLRNIWELYEIYGGAIFDMRYSYMHVNLAKYFK